MTVSPRCLLVRPERFGYHAEASGTNAYASRPAADDDEVAQLAVREFDSLVEALSGAGVEALVLDERDRRASPCPDSVFPNNWFSVHTVGGERVLVLYPMRDPERRRERWGDLRERICEAGVHTDRVMDLTHHEKDGRALEGTGSLVFDGANRTVFAARSARTDEALVREVALELGVEPVIFDATDSAGGAVYHTNVLMSIAPTLAISCIERITADQDRDRARLHLRRNGRTLIEIDAAQMDAFCANIIALPSARGGTVLAMSETARSAFTVRQIKQIETHAMIVCASIPTIEKVGGGSVRCMIAGLTP